MNVRFPQTESVSRSLLYGFMKVVVTCWCKLLYHFEVHGRDHIPDRGPLIIAPKHQYWTDIPLVAFAFYNIPLNYIAKEELFRFPVIRTFLTMLGGIPLDRRTPIKTIDSFKYLYYLLRREQRIVIFPEGTYYRGKIGKGKSRLIKMILKFQEEEKLSEPIPFIPVGVIYRKKRFRQRVRIKIGKPLYAGSKSDAEEFTRNLMGAIAFLSDMDLQTTKCTGENSKLSLQSAAKSGLNGEKV